MTTNELVNILIVNALVYYPGAYDFLSGAERVILDLGQMLESNDPTTSES